MVHLQSAEALAGALRRRDLARTVVLSPDLGGLKAAAQLADLLGVPVAACHKQRPDGGRPVVTLSAGSARTDRDVVQDVEIAGGRTVLAALDHVAEHGPASVRVACTHGLFTDGALQRLQERSDIAEIVCTDSVAIPAATRVAKLTVVPVAPVLAAAIDLLRAGRAG